MMMDLKIFWCCQKCKLKAIKIAVIMASLWCLMSVPKTALGFDSFLMAFKTVREMSCYCSMLQDILIYDTETEDE